MKSLKIIQIEKEEAGQFATREDFCRLFADDLDGLYLLAFLMTGDHEKAERCFVAGLEECVQADCVFKEWACSRAKRAIFRNAIRALQLQLDRSYRSWPITVFSRQGNILKIGDGYFEAERLLALGDLERVVFVMSVLEQQPEVECALLLGCSLQEIGKARTRALEQIVGSSRFHACA